MADGAVHVDTTAYTLEEVVALLVDLVAAGLRVVSVHADLPRTDGLATPTRWLLRGGRPTARWLIRRRYRVRVHGAERVPPPARWWSPPTTSG